MRYGRYNFQSVLEQDAILPTFKGSTFRGVFGLALKRVVCALKRQECAGCLLKSRCVYAMCFENPDGSNSEEEPEPGKPSPPHPFVIEPPLTSETCLRKGEAFDFTLILLGWANDYLPYFVYAFEQMGKMGIGRRVGGRRAGFYLERITCGDETIYLAEQKTLALDVRVDLHLDDPRPNLPEVNEITVVLQTPLRLKYQNHLHSKLPFHILIRAVLRRIASLNNCFGEGEPALDYKGLVARAEEVETVDSQVRWYDWRRYSNRQEQAMLMGGLVGQVSYRGNLGEFIPLIQYGEKVHLGKATAFGLGKIELRLP